MATPTSDGRSEELARKAAGGHALAMQRSPKRQRLYKQFTTRHAAPIALRWHDRNVERENRTQR